MTKNKTLILTSLLCLLPVVLAAVLYDRLPDSIAVHFNNAGTPDGFLPKALAVFGLPVLFAAINAYVHFRLNKDPKNEKVSSALKLLSMWALPLVSTVLMPITMFIAMGADIPVIMITGAIVGIVITLCGNYLPKCRRNYTAGIRLPWTLESEENWNKTHRFTGFVWVLGGLVFTAAAFFSAIYVTVGVIILLVALPVIYSYSAYKKNGAK